jgi:hypothetical protein
MKLFAKAVFLLLAAPLFSQEPPSAETPPDLKGQTLVLNITTRVGENRQEEWNVVNSKETIPGKPVSLRLLGENILISVQLTPIVRENGKNILIVQGQIWVNVPGQGVRYKGTIQPIFFDFGEPVYFFPLGTTARADNPYIELQIELQRYTDSAPPQEEGES